ncbi:hypothetical protein CTI12_AA168670 [Artemisia annua]|uniref:Uncharacterized protein n=1 Tax=Artemisia annua TaxID=35608 RepID=A0A2U1PCH8_ARTAN|nr:hypothetical protein CTI12_AA168670 [Artemisia annua]
MAALSSKDKDCSKMVVLEDLWQMEDNEQEVAKDIDKDMEDLEALDKDFEDLGKRITKLEVLFGRLKDAKDAKEAKEAKEANERKEAKEANKGTSSGWRVEEEGKASQCKMRKVKPLRWQRKQIRAPVLSSSLHSKKRIV